MIIKEEVEVIALDNLKYFIERLMNEYKYELSDLSDNGKFDFIFDELRNRALYDKNYEVDRDLEIAFDDYADWLYDRVYNIVIDLLY